MISPPLRLRHEAKILLVYLDKPDIGLNEALEKTRLSKSTFLRRRTYLIEKGYLAKEKRGKYRVNEEKAKEKFREAVFTRKRELKGRKIKAFSIEYTNPVLYEDLLKLHKKIVESNRRLKIREISFKPQEIPRISPLKCADCGGPLIYDDETGEIICRICGLVSEEKL